ncbi:hypothetical protein Tsp_15882, partial [Trichinella spiralis]|uniref:hypothetical protein n=1 Tax=Trichinella spiralis TaxID=6334 RepID=UPI0001EFD6A0
GISNFPLHVAAGFQKSLNVGTWVNWEALFNIFSKSGFRNKKFRLERSWCVCAVQQPSGRLAQPHEQKSTRAPPEFLQLILDEQGKTETVVRQIDDGYAHGRGSVRRSAAYGVQQRRVAALTGKLVHNEITVEHF